MFGYKFLISVLLICNLSGTFKAEVLVTGTTSKCYDDAEHPLTRTYTLADCRRYVVYFKSVWRCSSRLPERRFWWERKEEESRLEIIHKETGDWYNSPIVIIEQTGLSTNSVNSMVKTYQSTAKMKTLSSLARWIIQVLSGCCGDWDGDLPSCDGSYRSS